MCKINLLIFKAIKLDKIPLKERYFVIDDTILAKLGWMIENVSFIYDHNLGRSVLGYCIVTLGLFTANGFYPLDFAYSLGKKRHPKSSPEKIGDPRKSSGKRSFEATSSYLSILLLFTKSKFLSIIHKKQVPIYINYNLFYIYSSYFMFLKYLIPLRG